MPKKNLMINAAMCDARNICEDTLESYESITINAAITITTPESSALLHRYNVTMNCSNVLECANDVELMMHNGSYVIHASDTDGKPAVLLVNGSLTIEPGAEKAASRFISINVNGRATYPVSMSSSLRSLNVNGSADCYPDDAILLKKTFIVDKTFIKRCKNAKYYAKKRVILIEPSLDVGELINKGVLFITEKAVVAESLFEASLPLFTDKTEIIVLPDGCRFINDDTELSKSLLLKYGTKLYINGDLMLGPSDEELLKKLEYLHVSGDIRLPKALEEVFSGINAEYRNLHLVREKCIIGRVHLSIDNSMLEKNPGGITVIDSVNVKIAEDVSPELILERLELEDCVNVCCYPSQRSAVEQIADAVHIDDSGKSLKGLLGSLIPGMEDMKDVKMINAASYKF
ncbi:MAG: hypothetical protein GX144_05810 [Clostridiaceae bacterium]|jgi:hypothetical protein|nr:hypothetical protein [Clostridiaceae bacterium]